MTQDTSKLTTEDLIALVEGFRDLTANTDVKGVLAKILTQAAKLTGSPESCVLLFNRDRNTLYFAAATGPTAEKLMAEWGEFSAKQVPLQGSIAGTVFTTLESIVEDRLVEDARHYKGVDADTKASTAALMCVPLVAAGEPLGAIQLLNKTGGNYSERDRILLECFSEQAAIAIRNARLFEDLVAHMGLYSNRALATSVPDLVRELQTPPKMEELSVMFVDMRAFTQLCQVLNPDEVQRKADAFLTMVSEQILKHDGIVNKFLGDGVLALFREKDFARSAVRSAFAIVEEFRGLCDAWNQASNAPLDFVDVGIGIVTDSVVLGRVGSKRVRDFTALGVAVNLAAAYEHHARGGRRILADHRTYTAVVDFVEPIVEPEKFDLRKPGQTLGRPYKLYHLQPRTTQPMAKHVFLSYCHENKPEIAQLRQDLLAAGEAVWWDQDILPGQDWKAAIRQAMKRSSVVVLCLSDETSKRSRSGIYPEALDAIAEFRDHAPGSIFLIPIRLSACEIPPIEIDGTRTLDRLQYVDLFPAGNRSEGLNKLLQAIRASPSHS